MDTELLAVLTKVAECGGMVDDPGKNSSWYSASVDWN
jgi:hypothetical protein